jgi:hypothetical protein
MAVASPRRDCHCDGDAPTWSRLPSSQTRPAQLSPSQPHAATRRTKNKRLEATIERRPPRGSVWVSPAPLDQLAMPSQHRRRTHRQARPRTSRQRPGERGQNRSIDGSEPCSPRLPAQDRQLMPEQQDLEVLGAVRSAQQHDQLNQATKRQVDERPDHDNLRNQGRPKLPMSIRTRHPTGNRVSEPHARRGRSSA